MQYFDIGPPKQSAPLLSTKGKARALVLAGGLGTRLAPLTSTLPKCLVEIDGRPLLDRWNSALSLAGVSEAIINAHLHADQIALRAAFYNRDSSVKWTVFEETILLGTARTLIHTLEWLEATENFLVIYADNLSALDLSDFLAEHSKFGADMTVALFRSDNPSACGIAELNDDGQLIGFEEKPARPISNLANGGIYVVKSGVLGKVLDARMKDIAYDLLPHFIGRAHGYIWNGYHRDIGNIQSLEQARRDALMGKI